MSSIVGHSGGSMRAKWMSLVLFVIQNSILTIALRACSLYESSHNSSYIASTVVMFTEVLKLVLSTVICFVLDAQGNPYTFRDILVRGYVDDGADFLKLCVPAILYTIQNNLQYVIESAPLFLVLYQSKIITTAIFYSVLLSRRLGLREWFCVVLLAIGVSMVESSQHEISPHHASNIIGVISVVTACITSGFAGVYFEKILKSSRSSIWMINMQMSMLSSFFCVSLSLTQDTEEIIEFGLWKGYNMYVVLIIVLQAVTGLVVALVVKYSDNIHKGFGYGSSIIISNTIDAYLFNDTTINTTYTLGSLVVIVTTWAFITFHSTGSSTGISAAGITSSGGSVLDGDGHPLNINNSSSSAKDEENQDTNRKNDFYSRWITPGHGIKQESL